MNSCIFTGRLTKDPELRMTQNNKSVAVLSLAVNKYDKVTYIDCVAWEKTADVIDKYCKKGSLICISSEYELRSWSKDGKTMYKPEFRINTVEFLNKKEPEQSNYEEVTGYDDELPF